MAIEPLHSRALPNNLLRFWIKYRGHNFTEWKIFDGAYYGNSSKEKLIGKTPRKTLQSTHMRFLFCRRVCLLVWDSTLFTIGKYFQFKRKVMLLLNLKEKSPKFKLLYRKKIILHNLQRHMLIVQLCLSMHFGHTCLFASRWKLEGPHSMGAWGGFPQVISDMKGMGQSTPVHPQ